MDDYPYQPPGIPADAPIVKHGFATSRRGYAVVGVLGAYLGFKLVDAPMVYWVSDSVIVAAMVGGAAMAVLAYHWASQLRVW